MKFKIWTSFVIGWIKVGVSFIFPYIGSNFMGSLHAVLTQTAGLYHAIILLSNYFRLKAILEYTFSNVFYLVALVIFKTSVYMPIELT